MTVRAERVAIERELDVMTSGHRVPTVLWTPREIAGPRPLVLVGHGGGGDRRARWVVAMA
jgi:poly(3-hydroxybutyrate) depolymerase